MGRSPPVRRLPVVAPPAPTTRKSARLASKATPASPATVSVSSKRATASKAAAASPAPAAGASAPPSKVGRMLGRRSKYGGIVRPLPTPLTPQQTLDLERARHQAEIQRVRTQCQSEFNAKVAELHAQFERERRGKMAALELKLAEVERRHHEARRVSFSTSMDVESEQIVDAAAPAAAATSAAAAATASSSSAAEAAEADAAPAVLTEADRWTSLSLGRVIYPSNWPAHQSHHVTLQTLSSDSDPDDWSFVESQLRRNLPNGRLLALQRVLNRPLWARYFHARERLLRKYGNEALRTPESAGNEQLLWHGTRNNAPHLIYASADGFDVRLSGGGMFGPGLYFSNSSAYSGQSYAHHLNPPAHTNTNSFLHRKMVQQQQNNASNLPPVPPLFTSRIDSTDGNMLVRANTLPPGSCQMFLARVLCGTEYNIRQAGGDRSKLHRGRPPLRPFACSGCKKEIDLHELNLRTLTRVSVGAEELGIDVVTEAEAKKKEADKKKEQRKQEKAAAAASSKVKRAVRRRSKRSDEQDKSDDATPPTASSAAVAPAADEQPSAASVADESQSGVTPSAAEVADSTESAAATPASVADDAASMCSSSSSSAASAASIHFDRAPVHCPSCNHVLGTRASLLAHPYRYDSVVADHMRIVYDSDRCYPEYLVTYVPS